jgi:hypothetical protein
MGRLRREFEGNCPLQKRNDTRSLVPNASRAPQRLNRLSGRLFCAASAPSHPPAQSDVDSSLPDVLRKQPPPRGARYLSLPCGYRCPLEKLPPEHVFPSPLWQQTDLWQQTKLVRPVFIAPGLRRPTPNLAGRAPLLHVAASALPHESVPICNNITCGPHARHVERETASPPPKNCFSNHDGHIVGHAYIILSSCVFVAPQCQSMTNPFLV